MSYYPSMDVWWEAKQSERRQRFLEFLEEQHAFWTPGPIFDRCCIKWLAGGAKSEDFVDDFDVYDFRRGCEYGSNQCPREHPVVTLSYQEDTGTVASLTHMLDPFVNYFEKRVQEGTATLMVIPTGTKNKKDTSCRTYQLNGYLRKNRTMMTTGNDCPFGLHLVQVSPGAMDKSNTAQRRELEKKRPISKLVEEALEICRKHRLGSDLDIVDIAHLRLTSKAAGKIAARLATERMKAIRLDCLVMVDGKLHINGFPRVDNSHLIDHDAKFFTDKFGRRGSRTTVYKPACGLMQLAPIPDSPKAAETRGKRKNSKKKVGKRKNGKKTTFAKNDNMFVPTGALKDCLCSYDSGVLEGDSNPSKVDSFVDYAFDYRGHRVRLLLEPLQTAVDRHVISSHELVGEFYMREPAKLKAGTLITLTSQWGAKLECQIGESETIKAARERVNSETEDGDGNDPVHEQRAPTLQFQGSFEIKRVSFGFGTLLVCFGLQKRELLKKLWFRRHQQARPLSDAELSEGLAVQLALEKTLGADRLDELNEGHCKYGHG